MTRETSQARIITDVEGAYSDLTSLIPAGAWATCYVGKHRVPLMLRRSELFSGLADVESYYRRMRPHLIDEGLWNASIPMPEMEWSGRRGISFTRSGTIHMAASNLEEVNVLHELAHHLHRRKPRERIHGETFWSLYLAIVSVCIAPAAALAFSIYAREYEERTRK